MNVASGFFGGSPFLRSGAKSAAQVFLLLVATLSDYKPFYHGAIRYAIPPYEISSFKIDLQ